MSEFDIIVKDLKKRGYKLIGMGLYSEVFGHPNKNKVYKIICSNDGAYLQYAKKIKNLDNPYLPKIHSIKEGFKENVQAVIVIEKLETMDIRKSNKKISKTLNKDISGYGNCGVCLHRSDLENTLESTACKKLKQAIKIILEVAEEWLLDLHDENYMFRRTGEKFQLVFSDPISTP